MSIQEAFINAVKAGAQAGQKKYGVLASLTIAQGADESGWGQHVIANNIFGIKANGTTGPTVTVGTKEFVNGEYINTTAAFRAYPTVAASIEDHASFIASNARYANLLHCTDAQKACEFVKQDGYATDPEYAGKLFAIIQGYKLAQYDEPVPASVATTAPAAAKHAETIKIPRHLLYTQHDKRVGRHCRHGERRSDFHYYRFEEWLERSQFQRQSSLHRASGV